MTIARKYLFLSLILGILVTSTSCNRNEATFIVDTFVEMIVPAGISSDRILTLRQAVPIPLSIALEINNVNENDLVGIHGSLGFVAPRIMVESDLNFINEIEIDVLDPVAVEDLGLQDPNVEGLEIFHYVQRDFNSRTSIDLTPSLPNVQELVRDDMAYLQIEMSFNSPPPANFTMLYQLQLGVFEETP